MIRLEEFERLNRKGRPGGGGMEERISWPWGTRTDGGVYEYTYENEDGIVVTVEHAYWKDRESKDGDIKYWLS